MASNKRSIRPVVIMGFTIIFITFGVFGGWAAVAKLDSAVVAPGTISLAGNRKVVQHLEGGIVEEIFVREADMVEEGQPLLRLNSLEQRSNLQVVEFRRDVARIVEARLLAERYLKETFELPAHLTELEELPRILQETVDDQLGLFQDRSMILKSQTEILSSRIEQTHEQIRGLTQQKSALERRYENYTLLIERMEDGVDRGLIQNNLFSQRQDEYIQIEADLGQIISEIAQANNAIFETELQSLQVGQEYRERANTELDEVRAELTELEARVNIASDVLARTVITAPASGSIQELQVHTVNSVIRPGDVLMELVPEGEELIFTARISPTDIDNVSVGLSTEVRFSAFKARLIPLVLGRVENVSADVITPDNPNEMPYYLAKIDVPKEDIAEGIRERITAGMPVDVVITTGERTVVTYLLSPLMDAVRKSLLEE
jgi:HlyD family type I secretion membrane fusion protein